MLLNLRNRCWANLYSLFDLRGFVWSKRVQYYKHTLSNANFHHWYNCWKTSNFCFYDVEIVMILDCIHLFSLTKSHGHSNIYTFCACDKLAIMLKMTAIHYYGSMNLLTNDWLSTKQKPVLGIVCWLLKLTITDLNTNGWIQLITFR